MLWHLTDESESMISVIHIIFFISYRVPAISIHSIFSPMPSNISQEHSHNITKYVYVTQRVCVSPKDIILATTGICSPPVRSRIQRVQPLVSAGAFVQCAKISNDAAAVLSRMYRIIRGWWMCSRGVRYNAISCPYGRVI